MFKASRILALFLCLTLPLFPAPSPAQSPDVVVSSAIGGAVGGLAGLLVSMPSGCGGAFSDKVCRLPTVVKGFAAGNILGSALGATRAGENSSCGFGQRFGRSLVGGIIGSAVGSALVSTAHGYMRIGLSPLVQLSESGAAALMLRPCQQRGRAAFADSGSMRPLTSNEKLVRFGAGLGLAGGYAGLYIYFKHAWWSGQPAPHWFVQSDWDQNERDLDKFGHLFGGYQLTRITSELMEAGGVEPTRAALLGALYAYAFQFQIEEWDGTQKIYGFSPGDLVADAGGAALAVAQTQIPSLRAVKPVWSYRPTEAFRRRNEPGHGGQPRATTDYSGQTYWFSTDLHSLLPESARKFWPAFLRVSPGYSITDYVDAKTGMSIRAQRKILLSIDIDPEKLPGDNREWRIIKHELSFLRIPGPTLQLTPSWKFFPAYY